MRHNDAKNPDCWYGVENAAARKKIQNRLAQRARRRRKAGIVTRPCNGTSYESPSSSSQPSSDDTPQNWSLAPPLERTSPFSTITGIELPSTTAVPFFATEIPPSVFAALWDNGALLGLTCSTVVPAKSRPAGPHVPASLQPTSLQLTTVHPPWIDRFPFPQMRDRFIVLWGRGVVDEEAFLRDLFSLDSFMVESGGAGWDPGCWRMLGGFGGRWGWLFL